MQVQLWTASLRLLCRRSATGAGAADRAAAEALSSAVQCWPQLFTNANVLELCCWQAPLAALAALRCCRLAVAAGASPEDVQLLRRNAWRCAPLVLFERLRLAQLAWQSVHDARQQADEGRPETQAGVAEQQTEQLRQVLLEEQLQLMRRAVPDGFDAVLASVPAAASSADLRQLLGTAAALLSWRPGAAVLLACAEGKAEEAVVADAAAAARLGLAPLPSSLVESRHARLFCLHRPS